MPTFPRANVLGVGISAVDRHHAVEHIDGWIANPRSRWDVSTRDEAIDAPPRLTRSGAMTSKLDAWSAFRAQGGE